MPSPSPLIPRRRLGVELRRLREAAELNLEAPAEFLECSPSKISRLETGHGVPKPRDVRALLDLYRVDDQRVRDRLVRLAGEGRRQAWWRDMAEVVSANMDAFIALEAEASDIRLYASTAIPGLLQTPDYANALIRAVYPDDTTDDRAKRVLLRSGRQRIYEERTDEPRTRVVLHEAALRVLVGSTAVMADQLLALLSPRPGVDVRVYPFAAGPDIAIQCAYAVFTFDSEIDRNAVHIELSAGDRWLEHERDVRRYSAVFDRLATRCLCRDDAHRLIRSVVAEHARGPG
ncbi:helix-turn-helix transcriptional regulator [Actinokineospora sp. NBRC 105648]|uniref:helix-turn-helix domain-containing protein n=1 Tax=Actinokineospora sp. NBRC 105648 TaxID=3032206 RepID=UPI0024A2D695|nr:helix-turn-helix transcriptional regulator [Actinokineospora sp. NBRC 105648]GLZ42428.1 transcriptional regulator [Actinokineospora sp. NBRC 105648]